jgi:RNA-directed DNA polymerase
VVQSLYGHGQKLGFKTVIKSAEKKVKSLDNKLAEIIDAYKAAPQEALISRLNPLIRGWENYYSAVFRKETFTIRDFLAHSKLRIWAPRRHFNKTKLCINILAYYCK